MSEEEKKSSALVRFGFQQAGGIVITNVEDLTRFAVRVAESAYFEKDVGTYQQAMMKIQYGAELGIPPMASLNNIDLIEGRPGLRSALVAARIETSPNKDFEVIQADDMVCEIAFYKKSKRKRGRVLVSEQDPDDDGWVLCGPNIKYTIEMAQSAGWIKPKSAWEKTPGDMLFARCLTRGARRYCPELFFGSVHSTEELGDGLAQERAARSGVAGVGDALASKEEKKKAKEKAKEKEAITVEVTAVETKKEEPAPAKEPTLEDIEREITGEATASSSKAQAPTSTQKDSPAVASSAGAGAPPTSSPTAGTASPSPNTSSSGGGASDPPASPAPGPASSSAERPTSPAPTQTPSSSTSPDSMPASGSSPSTATPSSASGSASSTPASATSTPTVTGEKSGDASQPQYGESAMRRLIAAGKMAFDAAVLAMPRELKDMTAFIGIASKPDLGLSDKQKQALRLYGRGLFSRQRGGAWNAGMSAEETPVLKLALDVVGEKL